MAESYGYRNWINQKEWYLGADWSSTRLEYHWPKVGLQNQTKWKGWSWQVQSMTGSEGIHSEVWHWLWWSVCSVR